MNPARFLFSIWVTPVLPCSIQRIFIFILFKDNPFLSHTTIHFYPTTILFPIPLSISILVQNHFQNHSFPFLPCHPDCACFPCQEQVLILSHNCLLRYIRSCCFLPDIMNRYSSAMNLLTPVILSMESSL